MGKKHLVIGVFGFIPDKGLDCSKCRLCSLSFSPFIELCLTEILLKESSVPKTPSFESPHDKTKKMTCAPSRDSDQPGHMPSLIKVFAVRMKKYWVLSYP